MARRRRRAALSTNQAVSGGGNYSGGTPPAPNPANATLTTGGSHPQTGLGGNQAVTGPTAPHPGQHQVPGVPNPTVQPFMTPEQMMAYADARRQYELSLYDLDYEYATNSANTGMEIFQTSKQAQVDTSDARDAYAARGLANSSVRDADLFDIDATAALRKRFLSDQLDTLRLAEERQRSSINSTWSTYMTGLNQAMVANAQGVQADMPQWKTPPHWEPNKPPPKPGATPGSTAYISTGPRPGPTATISTGKSGGSTYSGGTPAAPGAGTTIGTRPPARHRNATIAGRLS